jgi:hypothetical protein
MIPTLKILTSSLYSTYKLLKSHVIRNLWEDTDRDFDKWTLTMEHRIKIHYVPPISNKNDVRIH